MCAQAIFSEPVATHLARWICDLRYEDIPERVLEKTRYQSVSVIASMHAGFESEAGQAVYRAATKWKKPGPCTVIPTGEKMALHETVLVNSAFSMALDYDDYLYMGHTGHSAVLGSWAICEEERLSTKDLITAQVIANELGARMGASSVLGPQNGQAWSFIHAVEGAALAAKLYGLNVDQTAHALSIALYQPTFTLWPGFMGPQSKVLTAAGPTITGIQAAQLAREGMTGAPEIFEHPRKGFWASFTWASLPHMFTGLGSSWFTDTLAYKKYPGCAYIDTTMDALFMILDDYEQKKKRRLTAGQVKKILIEASIMTIEMDNLSSEHVDETQHLSPVNINFSIPFNTAIGIVAGKHTGAEMTQDFLDKHEREIRDLSDCTTLHHDWEMTFQVAQAFDGVLGKNSVARMLKPGDYFRVLQGYRRQMGGKKKNSLDVHGLFQKHGRDMAKLAGKLLRPRRKASNANETMKGDLSGVDFTKFRMAFPSRVTIETREGEKFSARQDVPWGAPGQVKYFETVDEKFRTEAGVRLSETQVENALSRLRDFENQRLEEVIRYCCNAQGS